MSSNRTKANSDQNMILTAACMDLPKNNSYPALPTIQITRDTDSDEALIREYFAVKRDLRKSSLPESLEKRTVLSAAAKSAKRCHSFVDRSIILGQYVEHINMNGTNKNKKMVNTNPNSLRIESLGIFVPNEYLEAARAPGSLREELRQLRTINERWESSEDITNTYQFFEDIVQTEKRQHFK